MLGVLWLYLRLLGIETNSIYNFRKSQPFILRFEQPWSKALQLDPRDAPGSSGAQYRQTTMKIKLKYASTSMKLPMKNHWNEEAKLGKETLEENPRLKALAVEMPRRTEPGVVGRSRWPGGIDVLPLLAKRKFWFKISNFYNFTWTVIKRIFSHLVEEWIDCEGLATWENLCFFWAHTNLDLTIQWFWTEIHAVPPARAWAPNVFHWNMWRCEDVVVVCDHKVPTNAPLGLSSGTSNVGILEKHHVWFSYEPKKRHNVCFPMCFLNFCCTCRFFIGFTRRRVESSPPGWKGSSDADVTHEWSTIGLHQIWSVWLA